MTWVKLDDQFPDHPKIEEVGGDAAWLYVCGLCYCARYLTDGKIPKGRVPRLSDRKNPEKLARALVTAGMWFDGVDAYYVHDYLEFNPSREHVERERARDRAKKARGRGAQGRDERGRITGNVPGVVPGGHLGGQPGGVPPVPSPSPYPYEEENQMYVSEGLTQVSEIDDADAVIHMAARTAV